MAIDATRTVGELAAERISRTAVFDRFGLDYCCHGHVPLAEACRNHGVDVNQVVEALAAGDVKPQEAGDVDYASMPLTELADHIEKTHHAYTKGELPRLQAMMVRVVRAHSSRHPELPEVAMTLAGLCDELESHFVKEEQVLFPMIRQLEAAAGAANSHCGGSLKNPIGVMEHEHDSAGEALAKMRELTGGYLAPADGCMTYQALMEGLTALERDLHRHIHKENNILFPRAAALEEKVCAV